MNYSWVAGGIALLSYCGSTIAIAAEFSYSVDINVYYQGGPPADGKYLAQNFLVTAKSRGVAPKDFHAYIDFSTGPGTPVLKQAVCIMGELQPGWTSTYGGKSCTGWPDVITLPPGKTLYAASSTKSAPFKKEEPPSTFPVVLEAIKPFPDKNATVCAVPKTRGDPPKGKGVTLNVYQLQGAVGADGTIDQSKICVVATPNGSDAVGLQLWGSLVAKDRGKETHVGSYMCIIAYAPDKAVAGTPVPCSPKDNNDVPEKMWMPKQAKLSVASTVTFGLPPASAGIPVLVQTYGPGKPNPK